MELVRMVFDGELLGWRMAFKGERPLDAEDGGSKMMLWLEVMDMVMFSSSKRMPLKL